MRTENQLLNTSAAIARQRKAILDTTLLLTLIGSFVAIATAWYFRLLEAEMTAISWSYFGFVAAHVLVGLITDRFSRRLMLVAATALVQLLGIAFLAVMWHFAGGVRNPIFLLVFIIPVIAAGALQLRWLSAVLAVVSPLLASLVAFAESPELVWYAERLGLPGFSSPAAFAAPAAETLPGVEMTPAAMTVMLGWFGLVEIAAAVASTLLAGMTIRLRRRVTSEDLQNVSEVAIASASAPTIIIYANTAQVRHASHTFVNQMLLHADQIPGKTLFELVAFDQPAMVRDALQAGINLRLIGYRIGAEHRHANLSIDRFTHEAEAFALIRFEERVEPRLVSPEPLEKPGWPREAQR